MYILLIVILAILVLVFISIANVYNAIPLDELKRRARRKEEPAKSLYIVASYKSSSQILLYFLATITGAVFFVFVARRSPIWIALVADIVLIWLAYIWIPRSSINIVSQYLAQVLAKPIASILQYIHGPFRKLSKSSYNPQHTGLYEKSDIVKLLTKQQKQQDNRIDEFEINLLKQVLDFGNYQVLDVMTPKRRVHSISANETLGPIVLSELHKSEHSYFPVYENKISNIVGILNIASLTNSRITLKVNEIMSQSLYYVHEEQYLSEALQVIIKTSQEILIVINSNQDYVGIITAREILKKLVGEIVTEEFDSYDNRELVADRFLLPKEPEIDLPEIEDTQESNEDTEVS